MMSLLSPVGLLTYLFFPVLINSTFSLNCSIYTVFLNSKILYHYTVIQYTELKFKNDIESGREPKLRFLARAWNVPKSTLQRRVKGVVAGFLHASGRKPLLPPAAEKELADMLMMLSKRGFPLRATDVKTIVFDYAKAKGIKGFSEAKKKAGYYWFQGFMKRNPKLSIRKPESLSAARAAGMNPEVVTKWFEDYEALLEELGIKGLPSHLWNCDESGLQDNFSSSHAVGEVGKPCYEITAGEKGETTTILAAFNAVGTYAPVMVIFKGKRVRAEWLYGSPDNALVKVSDNGWINGELFVEWGKAFVSQLPKDDRPHLLLLDGHSSHVYNMEFLTYMKANNVHVMSYPPHTTHALQPADRALFKSLKHNWSEVGRRWNRQSCGMKLPKLQFFSVFTEAWQKTATVENAQSGFRATGMFPVNRNVISADFFSPSATTERALQPLAPPMTITGGPQPAGLQDAVPSTSTGRGQDEEAIQSTSSGRVSFHDLIEVPRRERTTRKPRAKPPSYRLTSQDHFLYVERAKKGKEKVKVVPKNKKQNVDVNQDQTKCTGCQKTYGDREDPKTDEGWIQCSMCQLWYHESCAEEYGLFDDVAFICKDCFTEL